MEWVLNKLYMYGQTRVKLLDVVDNELILDNGVKLSIANNILSEEVMPRPGDVCRWKPAGIAVYIITQIGNTRSYICAKETVMTHMIIDLEELKLYSDAEIENFVHYKRVNVDSNIVKIINYIFDNWPYDTEGVDRLVDKNRIRQSFYNTLIHSNAESIFNTLKILTEGYLDQDPTHLLKSLPDNIASYITETVHGS